MLQDNLSKYLGHCHYQVAAQLTHKQALTQRWPGEQRSFVSYLLKPAHPYSLSVAVFVSVCVCAYLWIPLRIYICLCLWEPPQNEDINRRKHFSGTLCVDTLTQMMHEEHERGLSLASPSHTDPENHSGTYSGKDPLRKPNHHSLRCAPTPVGKQQSGGQRDHKFKLFRHTTGAEASEQ